MSGKPYQVLFICTGNSARSILAEAIMNKLAGDRFRAHSAGSHPKGEVHAMALATLTNWRIATTGLRSKCWDEFAQPGAPELDFVFTVCDNAAGEACPLWPGQPISAHWGVPDPAVVEGTDEYKAKAFFAVALTLKRRIELLAALPLASLDGQRIKRELAAIGAR